MIYITQGNKVIWPGSLAY